MRVISGIYKGRKLKSPPKNANIRPTTDRVKETLFNILANRVDFEDAKILDLFSGTGAFGIECLSRGAVDVTFVDKDIRLTKENLDLVKAPECAVIKGDAISYLKNAGETYDIIFADPPYDFDGYERLIQEAVRFTVLFVLEHSSKNAFEDASLRKDFGDTSISFFAN